MAQAPAYSHRIRVADLPRSGLAFDLSPDADELTALKAVLEVTNLKKVRFRGTLKPLGRKDWALSGDLGATVVQPCVVTFQPVTTRLDLTVARTYLAEAPEYEAGTELEMPEDDSAEPLPAEIDLGAILAEEISLNLPPYPHAPDVEPADITVTAPGQTPMTDEDIKPFAGLGALRDKLAKNDDDGA